MNSARHSRNRIVLVVVLVIEPGHSIEDEDENENEDEKFARRANILRDSSTDSWLILSTTRFRRALRPARPDPLPQPMNEDGSVGYRSKSRRSAGSRPRPIRRPRGPGLRR